MWSRLNLFLMGFRTWLQVGSFLLADLVPGRELYLCQRSSKKNTLCLLGRQSSADIVLKREDSTVCWSINSHLNAFLYDRSKLTWVFVPRNWAPWIGGSFLGGTNSSVFQMWASCFNAVISSTILYCFKVDSTVSLGSPDTFPAWNGWWSMVSHKAADYYRTYNRRAIHVFSIVSSHFKVDKSQFRVDAFNDQKWFYCC